MNATPKTENATPNAESRELTGTELDAVAGGETVVTTPAQEPIRTPMQWRACEVRALG